MLKKHIYNTFLLAIGLIMFLGSCQEDITIKTERGLPDKVVVEGRITNQNKQQIVRLTTTSDYFDTNSIKKADIQSAYIYELGTGNQYALQPVDTGIGYYATEAFSGKIGEEYQLDFDFNGDAYSASAYLDTIAQMDSIGYVYEYNKVYEAGFYRIQMTATEPEPAGDYYMFNLYVNDTLYNDKLRLTSFTNDEFFNGMTVQNIDIVYLPQEEIKMDTNFIRVEMLSISKEEYNFDNAFLSETMGNGSIFSGPPADVPSNLKNNTTVDKNGLGFFAASSVVSREMFLIKQHDDSTNDPEYKK